MGATRMQPPLQLELDGAWESESRCGASLTDARNWGPQLRFSAPHAAMEKFDRLLGDNLAPFILYGSGDFHHLTALFLRRIREPFILLSFDNHPDWDIRPPHWACGGWINRALELENLVLAAVWGCGNSELRWPQRIFGNLSAVRSQRLRIYSWVERYPQQIADPWNPISRADWRSKFENYVEQHAGESFYVTIDMDCLARSEAVTNWENGLFTADDLVWAISAIRSRGKILGGDLCGAYSTPGFARWTQKFASNFDHPKIGPIDEEEARRTNARACAKIWPALIGI